jgi:hypothetical protein
MIEESGAGFGDAALSVAREFRLTPEAAAARANGFRLKIEIPSPRPPLRAVKFEVDKCCLHLGPPGPFYPEMAYRSLLGGSAELECRISDDRRLRDCRAVLASPPGWGFDHASLRMAHSGWITAGEAPPGVMAPVDGVWTIRLEFPAPPYGPFDARARGKPRPTWKPRP